MLRIIALDSGPFGLACDNPKKASVRRIRDWMLHVLADGRSRIILPEVVDYEVRRKLMANIDGSASLLRIDELVKPGGLLVYVPIATKAMRTAARLWAEARRGGYSTAGPDSLDADVILAAQALEYVGLDDQWWVATGNDSDLSRYVGERAQPWEAITP